MHSTAVRQDYLARNVTSDINEHYVLYVGNICRGGFTVFHQRYGDVDERAWK